jgi:hypothetical protein
MAEIPLLRESRAFAVRLVDAARRFGEPRYHFHRRVNWSYRYAADYYASERARFVAAPEAYLAGSLPQESPLADVYAQRLGARQVGTVIVKVLAHRLFRALGAAADRKIRARRVRTYRKCYVDDIELVFDTAEADVVRAVYPFPISVPRQLRYVRFLRREHLFYKLDGNPYLLRDVARFIARRDVRSLMRMESRAPLRQARTISSLGVATVQLSDEFDIGSLDFVRALSRSPVRVVNCAHGVGKYFPVHAYREFLVLTQRQEQYYHAARPCRYALRRLNDKACAARSSEPRPDDEPIRLVFLSQTFTGSGDLIAENESALLALLRRRLSHVPGVELFYKPHPNRQQVDPVPGFSVLDSLDRVNGREGTVFASFFSTCQIYPAFKGRKVLVRGRLIYPEIAFDDSEPIVDFDQLADLVTSLASAQITS